MIKYLDQSSCPLGSTPLLIILDAIVKMYILILDISQYLHIAKWWIINGNQGTSKCAKSLTMKSMLLLIK